MDNKVYLGDSVYAEWVDGFMIRLTTENGLPYDPSNIIYLDTEVFENLTRWFKKITKQPVVDRGEANGDC